MKAMHGSLAAPPLAAIALAAFLLGGPVIARAADVPAFPDSIVVAERAFARASIEKGTREAFLMFLDDEGIVFHPQPVNGKGFYGSRPARPGALIWQPAHAEIAAAGTMGYTTGPWEYREGGPEGKAIAWGYYVSVWHATPDSGLWKVLADIGISLDAPADSVVEREVTTVRTAGFTEHLMDQVEAARALIERDKALTEAGGAEGHAKALEAICADDLRVYREGAPPWVGREAAIAAVGERSERWRAVPLSARAAPHGDFGYTFGVAAPVASDSTRVEPGSYLRVWHKGDGGVWQVALEVILPGPAKTE